MHDFLKFIFGLVCGLLGVGLILLTARQPRGQAVTLAPPPTPAPILVQVDGAVAQPGVFSLPAGSRVREAVLAAGGLIPLADTGTLNQAAILNDGDRITVSEKNAATATPLPPPKNTTRQTTAPPAKTAPTGTVKKVNINTATQQELEALPGIGPYLAEQIIAFRKANGAFKTTQAILEVPGIGQKTFERIKDLISV